MNESAVFWFEFFSKRFRPGPSSVELQSTLETLQCLHTSPTPKERTYVRVYADVMTKFSQMDSLPNCPTRGVPLRALRGRYSSAIKHYIGFNGKY